MIIKSYNRRFWRAFPICDVLRGQFREPSNFTKGNPPLLSLYYRKNILKITSHSLIPVASIFLFINNAYESNNHLRDSIIFNKEFSNVMTSHRESKEIQNYEDFLFGFISFCCSKVYKYFQNSSFSLVYICLIEM